MVVNEISKERKSLARSMRDVDSAIGKLDDVLVAVVFIITIFIFISFLNTNFTTTLATAGTILLSLSFIFSASCQEILASILFLFYKVLSLRKRLTAAPLRCRRSCRYQRSFLCRQRTLSSLHDIQTSRRDNSSSQQCRSQRSMDRKRSSVHDYE
jgi:hypothetical protein